MISEERAEIFTLAGVFFAFTVAVHMITPYIGLHSLSIGIPIPLLAAIFTAEYGTAVGLRLPSAGLADRYGRKKIMTLGELFFTIGIAMYVLVLSPESRGVDSWGRSPGSGVVPISAINIVSNDRYSRQEIAAGGEGIHGFARAHISHDHGAGAWLFSLHTRRLQFVFGAALVVSIGSLAVTSIMIRDDGFRDRSKGFIIREINRLREVVSKDYSLALTSRLLMSYFLATIIIFVPILAVEKIGLHKGDVGLLFSAAALLNLISRLLAGKMWLVAGERRIMIAGLLVGAASCAILAFAENSVTIWIAMSLYGISAGLFNPSIFHFTPSL